MMESTKLMICDRLLSTEPLTWKEVEQISKFNRIDAMVYRNNVLNNPPLELMYSVLLDMHKELIPQNDVMGYSDDFLCAIHDDDLQFITETGDGPPEAMQAAKNLTICLGICRIHGIDPDIDGTLWPHYAIAAGNELCSCVEQWEKDCLIFPERWDNACQQHEADDLCMTLLYRSIDIQAAYVALTEAQAACLHDNDTRICVLNQVIENYKVLMRRYDDTLKQQIDILSTIADTPLLDAWQKNLGHLNIWWLNGSLKKRMEELYHN